MSSEFNIVLDELEAATTLMDRGRRREVLRKITQLFTDQADRLSSDIVFAFDAVIIRLLRGLDGDVRAELARALADVPNAPAQVIRKLAFDPSAEIAGPVLRRSARLSESDLALLAERSERHHLAALAQRASLCSRVSEILVKRADRATIRVLAGNAGASFTDWAQASLVRRAASDPPLRAALETRDDLSATHRKRLTEVAAQHREQSLNDAFGVGVQQALLAGA